MSGPSNHAYPSPSSPRFLVETVDQPCYNGSVKPNPNSPDGLDSPLSGPFPAMDRTAFEMASLDDPDDSAEYWKHRTPEERLAGVELMRQILYGYDPATARLQRVLQLAELE